MTGGTEEAEETEPTELIAEELCEAEDEAEETEDASGGLLEGETRRTITLAEDEELLEEELDDFVAGSRRTTALTEDFERPAEDVPSSTYVSCCLRWSP